MKNHEFTFAMNVAKSTIVERSDGNSKMVITGVASNTSRDKQGERVSIKGLESIQKAIEKGMIDGDGEWSHIPLRSGHRKEWDDVLGWVISSEIDDKENLWITAELDEDSHAAQTLYRKITKGNQNGKKTKLGLSIHGKATNYEYLLDEESNSYYPYLHSIDIDEVSVTGSPANPTPYGLAIAKSLVPPEYTVVDETAEKEIPMENEEIQQVEEQLEHEHTADTAAERAEVVAETAADKFTQVPAYTAETTTQAETQDVTTEEVVATPDSNLQQELASVVEAVNALKQQVESLVAERRVEKAETEPLESEPVANEDMDQKIALSVAKALKDLGITNIMDTLSVVKSSLEDLSEQPADRSISVSKAKAKDEEDANDPLVRMNRLIAEGQDPIRAALMSARK